ncbi:Rod shape-determining protein MreC [Fimbriimonas ginsengisoli Gsoil 348]|uniref:Cell shape-determining protein MreC n=1 Tax=Fimbriimonas ginsengisoli Gsoil 348 TaxID=661478 RepID=A0A068NQK9_FIMGI|nr:Rod shape-determining protein MreC [Fimbriimonas ginsengisoli Gsoil 348]
MLILLIVTGVVLGRLQTASRTAGKVDPISAAIRSAVVPSSGPLNSLANSSGGFFSGIFSAGRLKAENQRLQALANAGALYTEQVQRLQGEIDRIRVLQGMGPIPGKTRVPADVIGYALYENRLTLNVGSRQGVQIGCPVESAEGLVGTVQVVEADRCQVLLLTSASLTLGAIDQSRNPPPAGLLRGENSSTLTLTFQDPKAPVEIGDHIVTSGFSDRIPRGILIGKVISVATDEQFGSLRAKVDPAVSVGNLREVHVLR